MRFHIEDEDADRIGGNIRQAPGHDPLAIGCTTIPNVRAVTDDMLSGLRPITPGVALLPIDEVGVAILVHLGIHPVAAAALGSEANGIGIENEDGDVVGEVLMDTVPPFHISFDGLKWNGEMLSIPAVPETVRMRLPTDDEFDELPLVELLSHPALDPLKLDIMWVEDDPKDETRLNLVLSIVNRAQARGDMEAAWERRYAKRSGKE